VVWIEQASCACSWGKRTECERREGGRGRTQEKGRTLRWGTVGTELNSLRQSQLFQQLAHILQQNAAETTQNIVVEHVEQICNSRNYKQHIGAKKSN
jgi:hypothetical protein